MKIVDVFKTDGPGHVYFMSDLHYGHSNILKMTKRPFTEVSEMNNWIEDTLSTLTRDDVVFNLGDFFWKISPEIAKNILSSIPAKMYMVLGNHDKYGLYDPECGNFKDYFELVSDILDIKVNYKGIDYLCTLCHYPMVSWNHKSSGSLMIHGHTHGNIDNYNNSSPDLRLDVGVDSEIASIKGSFLVEFEDIYKYLQNKTGGNTFQNWVWNKVKIM